MPAKKPINQLDPFGDNDDRYQTREIRHSRSRSSKNPFTNLADPKSKEGKRSFIILSCVFLAIIIGSILVIVLSNRANAPDPTSDGDPLVNPTGREASSEYTVDKLNDPELRANEQSKLESVLVLISEEDWNYAHALFNTIFPDYLDACGKYDYYRAALRLADNIPDFAISRERATERMDILLKTCNRPAEE